MSATLSLCAVIIAVLITFLVVCLCTKLKQKSNFNDRQSNKDLDKEYAVPDAKVSEALNVVWNSAYASTSK